MRTSCLCRSLAWTRVCLARRGHGGAAQAQRELERLALLEQAMAQPATVRAQQSPAVTPAAAAAYLREASSRVEELRAAARADDNDDSPTPGCSHNNSDAAQPPGSSEPQVSNLTQFLSTCKQLKIRFSSDSDPASRRRGREQLCRFWARHATSAVACCYQGVREVGFVADCGLVDTGMHLELPAMWAMLRVLKAESAVASSVDATRTLQYLARELQFLERGGAGVARRHRENASTASPSSSTVSSSDLLAFRQTLTDLAIDRLAFYFVQHGAAVNTSLRWADATHEKSALPGSDSGEGEKAAELASTVNTSIASAVDALSGLEVLSVLSATDATTEAVAQVWEQRHVWSLRQQRGATALHSSSSPSSSVSAFPPNAAAASSSQALAQEVHYLLVAELFRFAAQQRRGLRLTDTVHGFALLRIHLRTLWPPYASWGGVPANDGDASSPSTSKDRAGSNKAARSRASLWYEKDTLFRVTWGLAAALISKERKLVSSYHYVKIVATLTKLPGFVLAPEPVAKQELRRLGASSRDGGAASAFQQRGAAEARHSGRREELPDDLLALLGEHESGQRSTLPAAPQRAEDDAALVALRPADFWRFIVAKACVFMPSLPPDQRRVICRGLHLAITEKRGHLLGHGGHKGPRSSHQVHPQGLAARSGFARPVLSRRPPRSGEEDEESDDDAASIVRPLIEEMAAYTDNYYDCIKDTRPPPPLSHHGSTAASSKQRKRPKW